MVAALDRTAGANRNQRNQERKAEEVMRCRNHGSGLGHHDVLRNDGYGFIENREHRTAVAWPNLRCRGHAQNRSN
jgi:hypothetical protein